MNSLTLKVDNMFNVVNVLFKKNDNLTHEKELMMKKFYFSTFAIFFVLVLPALTFAGHHYGKQGGTSMMRSMSDLDTDGDGILTFDEYVTPVTKKWQKGFSMIDANNDGEINAEEWDAFLEVHGKTNF